MNRLRVAVNMTWCIPGRVGGSEEYLCRQLLGLPSEPFSVETFVPQGFRVAHPEIVERHTVTELPHDSTSRGHRVWSESTWLYRRTESFDLVHHGGGTIPMRTRRPVVLTIHDLQYLTFPQYFRTARRVYLQGVMPRSARRADVITVPSEFVRRSVVEAYGIDSDRIVVVPHGVEHSLGRNATDPDTLRRKYGLGQGPIVVMPAVTHPHKGHQFLLDVMERSWRKAGLTLVLIGGAGLAENEVARRATSAGLRQCVVKLGRVPADDRDGLVAMAEAMAFPSEYEGFGAPVIEAMALGTPVVVSDRTCLPDIVGDAGIVLPLDRELWAGALDVVRTRRVELVARGRRRIEEFSAEASGRAVAAAYGRAMEFSGVSEQSLRSEPR